MIILIVFIIISIYIYLVHTKIEFLKLRNQCTKISAEVIEYRKEKGPMRNDNTELDYPYVKIDLENDEYVISKLKYANNMNKPFAIGKKVEVFWHGSNLLYWNTFDNGIYKYIPNKWCLLN